MLPFTSRPGQARPGQARPGDAGYGITAPLAIFTSGPPALQWAPETPWLQWKAGTAQPSVTHG